MRVFSINTYGCCHLIATNASSLTSSIAPLCATSFQSSACIGMHGSLEPSTAVNAKEPVDQVIGTRPNKSKYMCVHLHREREIRAYLCIQVTTFPFPKQKKKSCLAISLVSKSNLEISLGHSNWQKLSSSSAYNQRK